MKKYIGINICIMIITLGIQEAWCLSPFYISSQEKEQSKTWAQWQRDAAIGEYASHSFSHLSELLHAISQKVTQLHNFYAMGNREQEKETFRIHMRQFGFLLGKILQGQNGTKNMLNFIKEYQRKIYSEEEQSSVYVHAMMSEPCHFEQFHQNVLIGQSVGGVIHDINNMMQSLFGFFYIVEIEMNKENWAGVWKTFGEDIDTMVVNIETATALAENFQKLILQKEEEKETVNLTDRNGPLEQALQLVAFYFRRVSVIKEYGSIDGYQILIQRQKLMRVFFNIFKNAGQAFASMKNNGNPHMVLIRIDKKKEIMQGNEQDVMVVRIEDNAGGMSRETMEHLFTSFYTSKPYGTGLGLVTCKRMIEEQGGYITVSSEECKGTVFTIVLPVGEVGRISSIEHKAFGEQESRDVHIDQMRTSIFCQTAV